MRLHLCAVGRLRSGPERALVDDYLQRCDRTGRPLGLGPVTEHEVEDKRGAGMAAEAGLLLRAAPAGAVLCAMQHQQDVGRDHGTFVVHRLRQLLVAQRVGRCLVAGYREDGHGGALIRY